MKEIIKEFDLELAKKITSGEIKGLIRTKKGLTAKLLSDEIINDYPLAIIITNDNGIQSVESYRMDGRYSSFKNHFMNLEIVLLDEEPNQEKI